MLEPEPTPEFVRKWVDKADNDLKAGSHLLTLGKDSPTDAICFHAQQCIEKYLKALLIVRRIAFPKTHDLHALLTMLTEEDRPTLDKTTQEQMTDYATVGRYPDELIDPTLAEARQAVATYPQRSATLSPQGGASAKEAVMHKLFVEERGPARRDVELAEHA